MKKLLAVLVCLEICTRTALAETPKENFELQKECSGFAQIYFKENFGSQGVLDNSWIRN
jgi:hypothetical protein